MAADRETPRLDLPRIAAAARCSRSRCSPPSSRGGARFAAAFVGWNPLLAVHFAGGGHNDALMMALVLGALAARRNGRRQLAGACLGGVDRHQVDARSSSSCCGRSRRRATGRPVRHLGLRGLGGRADRGVASGATGSPGWAPSCRSRKPREAGRLLDPASAVRASGSPSTLRRSCSAASSSLAFVWLLREAWRGRARLALAAGLLLVATPWLVPWYAVWAVPLAAIERRRSPGASCSRS